MIDLDDIMEVLPDGTIIMVAKNRKIVRLSMGGSVCNLMPGDIIEHAFKIFKFISYRNRSILVGIAGEDGKKDSSPQCMWMLGQGGQAISYFSQNYLAKAMDKGEITIFKGASKQLTPQTIKDEIRKFLLEET